MYRVRSFEPGDLRAIERDVPACAGAARDVARDPGGLVGIVVDDPRGRLCGCLIASRRELVTSSRTVGLGIVRIAHIAQDARIGGVHGLLFEMDCAFAERFEGPERPLQAVVAQWDERDLWWFRRLRDFEPIAACLTFAGPVVAVDAPAGVVIEPIGPAALEALDVVDVGGGAATGIRRTRDALVSAAQRTGRRCVIARRGAVVVAWAVVRDDPTGAVLEVHSIDHGDAALAVATLAAAGRARPSLRATRWTDLGAELATMQAAGLRVRGPERPIAARVSAFGLAPATVAEFASFGEDDVGDRPLPWLSHNDTILLPPPPGTRTTQGDHRRTRGNHPHQPR